MLFKIFKILLLVFILLVAGVASLVWYGLQEKPLAHANSSQQIENAESVTRLIRQLKNSLVLRNYTQNIVVTKDQLDSVIGLAQRAKPELTAQVDLQKSKGSLALSYKLPNNPFGRYVNIEVSVEDAERLLINEVKYGELSISGEWVLTLLTMAVDWRTDSDIASDFLTHIERVRIYPHGVFITLQPIDEFLQKLNEIRNGVTVTPDEPLRQKTAFYLRFLSNLPFAREAEPSSLSRFISPLFLQVQSRASQTNVADESDAALLALAIYAGHHRVANMVGEVQPIKGEVAMPLYRPLLANRTDLTQHFLLSAAIHILSQRDVSMAIGEFKELMDRAIGGSGYSFVDLAADMAGIKMASELTENAQAQVLVDRLAAATTEALFFPSIIGLQEGISKKQFIERFGQVDSAAYKRQVTDIERGISQLPLYQAGQ